MRRRGATSCEQRAASKHNTELAHRSGVLRFVEARSSKLEAGFTLIEMMVVISVILILLSIALPLYSQYLQRTKEAKFRHDLKTLNDVIEAYSLDKKKAPQTLDDLVQAGYLKFLPPDITGSKDTWVTEPEDPQNAMDPNQPGIASVHSGSEQLSSEGTPYSSWVY